MITPETCQRVEPNEEMICDAREFLTTIDNKADELANVLNLLGNPIRLKMVTLLAKYNGLCVCDLGSALNVNQSPLSQHLRKLKDGGVLQKKREGLTIYYSLNEKKKTFLLQIINMLDKK